MATDTRYVGEGLDEQYDASRRKERLGLVGTSRWNFFRVADWLTRDEAGILELGTCRYVSCVTSQGGMVDTQATGMEAVLKRLEDLLAEVVAIKLERDTLQMALQQGEQAEKTVRLKPPKPERFVPSRSGSVRTWLFGLNNYFAAVGMPENQGEARIAFALTLLDGAALEWWRQLQNNS